MAIMQGVSCRSLPVVALWFTRNSASCIYNRNIREDLRKAYRNGHQIGSHTWTHRHLPNLTYAEIYDEFNRTSQAFREILGVEPAMVRPPYGEYDDKVRRVARDRNQTLVNWDLDTRDSLNAAIKESKNITMNTTDRISIVLMHETLSESTVP
jgi:peptidoglycan/xylan/chitin deacetylase (PgdA/CDA1 family)